MKIITIFKKLVSFSCGITKKGKKVKTKQEQFAVQDLHTSVRKLASNHVLNEICMETLPLIYSSLTETLRFFHSVKRDTLSHMKAVALLLLWESLSTKKA